MNWSPREIRGISLPSLPLEAQSRLAGGPISRKWLTLEVAQPMSSRLDDGRPWRSGPARNAGFEAPAGTGIVGQVCMAACFGGEEMKETTAHGDHHSSENSRIPVR